MGFADWFKFRWRKYFVSRERYDELTEENGDLSEVNSTMKNDREVYQTNIRTLEARVEGESSKVRKYRGNFIDEIAPLLMRSDLVLEASHYLISSISGDLAYSMGYKNVDSGSAEALKDLKNHPCSELIIGGKRVIGEVLYKQDMGVGGSTELKLYGKDGKSFGVKVNGKVERAFLPYESEPAYFCIKFDVEGPVKRAVSGFFGLFNKKGSDVAISGEGAIQET